MDRSEVLTLISKTFTADAIGQMVPTETEVQVYCQLNSVTQQEWYEAGRAGLKAEYRATVNREEYGGQEMCKLNNVRYGIYRTYVTKGDKIELYLERKAGV